MATEANNFLQASISKFEGDYDHWSSNWKKYWSPIKLIFEHQIHQIFKDFFFIILYQQNGLITTKNKQPIHLLISIFFVIQIQQARRHRYIKRKYRFYSLIIISWFLYAKADVMMHACLQITRWKNPNADHSTIQVQGTMKFIF